MFKCMMKRNILLVGAGQLGSRYLQGFAACKFPLQIFVQDIHPDSLARSEERWSEVAGDQSRHKISFHASLSRVPKEIDLAIVATTAEVRPRLVQEIVRGSSVRYWILEKVLAQSEVGVDSILAAINGKAWVNTVRRAMPWHQMIKAQLGLGSPVTMDLRGGLWGLACNAVHLLDLLAWWSGEKLQYVNTGRLDSNWFESKRAGNWEVSGTLEALFSGGSRASLTATGGGPVGEIHVTDGVLSWIIDESLGVARRSDGLELDGRMMFQSELTAGIVDTILTSGTCDLPTLKESAELHRVFIRGMQEHWQQAGNPQATVVPIT